MISNFIFPQGPEVEVPEECFEKYSDHETAPCEEECEEEGESVIRYSNNYYS